MCLPLPPTGLWGSRLLKFLPHRHGCLMFLLRTNTKMPGMLIHAWNPVLRRQIQANPSLALSARPASLMWLHTSVQTQDGWHLSKDTDIDIVHRGVHSCVCATTHTHLHTHVDTHTTATNPQSNKHWGLSVGFPCLLAQDEACTVELSVGPGIQRCEVRIY